MFQTLSTLAVMMLLANIFTNHQSFAFQPEPPASHNELRLQIDAQLNQLQHELIAFRRDLHEHPELSGEEKRTAGVIAERLRGLGLEVREGIGGHGVVGLLKGSKPGPVVAFRADMDAVRSNEPDPVAFASQVAGIRHICGHDIHTTIGIAIAEGLSHIREDLTGSVLFIFQPAEENVQGARAMLEDGALENPRPSAIYAYHTAPMEVGQIGSKTGVMMAGRDRVEITLKGNGDLEAPARTIEKAIRELNTVQPNETSVPGAFIQARVFSSRAMAGDQTWRIQAGLTLAGDDMRQRANQALSAELAAFKKQGISSTFEYQQTNAAGVTNDEALEYAARAPMRSVIGDDGLVTLNSVPTGFSEDFGLFQKEVPGVMYFLGVSNSEKGWVGMPHSPGYVADEASILVGARAMSAVILDFGANHER